jgi:hypothetical protein
VVKDLSVYNVRITFFCGFQIADLDAIFVNEAA